MARNLEISPGEMRKATLLQLYAWNRIELRNPNDTRMKLLMGLVEIGEVKLSEEYKGGNIIYSTFTLTGRGEAAAKRIAAL